MASVLSPSARRAQDKPATDQVVFANQDTEFRLVWNLDCGPLGLPRKLVRPCTRERVGPLMEVDILVRDSPIWMGQRLDEEALLGALLKHPAIARVLDLFELPYGAFLVREHIEGCTLNAVINRATLRQQPMSEAFCLYLTRQVAGALHCAYTSRDDFGKQIYLLHRSVSPGSIRVSLEGEVKLTDFAAAYFELPKRLQTPGGLMRGSLAYSAPERLSSPDGVVDGRADLFSLGMVMLELLTGKNLYGLESVEREAQALRTLLELPEKRRAEEPGWASVAEMALLSASFQPEDVEGALQGVSAPVKELVHGLLRVEPDERYATAEEVERVARECMEVAGCANYGPKELAKEVLLATLDAEHSPLRHQAGMLESSVLPGLFRRPR